MIRDMFSSLRALKMRIFTALCKEQTYGFFEIDLPSLTQWLWTLDEKASILLHHDAITSTSPTGTL